MKESLPEKIETQLDCALANFHQLELSFSYTTLKGQVNCFKRIYLAAQDKFNDELICQLEEAGLHSFQDENIWAEFEWAIINTKKIKLPQPLRIVVNIYRALSKDPTANSPSTLCWRQHSSSISFFYKISSQLVCELRQAHQKLVSDKQLPLFWPRGIERKDHTEPKFVSGLKKLINSDKVAAAKLRKEGLAALKNHPSIVDSLIHINEKPERQSTYNFLRQFVDAEMFAAKEVILTYGEIEKSTHKVNLAKEFSLSVAYYEELKIYVKYLNEEGDGTSTDIQQLFNKFHQTKAVLSRLLVLHGEDLLCEAKKNGYRQLLNNNQTNLRKFLYEEEVEPQTKKLVYGFLSAISEGNLPDYYDLIPYTITFPMEHINKNHALNCRFLYENYRALFSELKAQVGESIDRIDLENFVIGTLRSHIDNFQRLIALFNSQLTFQEKSFLQKMGMRAFSGGRFSLQTKFFQLLQQEAVNGNKARQTIVSIRNSFIWTLRRFDLEIQEAFPIPVDRTKKHAQRTRQDDYYTAAECRALAFFIEKKLRNDDASNSHKTQYLLARVFLKTGWNLSDVLRLKTDDITQYTENAKDISKVRLQKARAGYKTTQYLFDLSPKKVATPRGRFP